MSIGFSDWGHECQCDHCQGVVWPAPRQWRSKNKERKATRHMLRMARKMGRAFGRMVTDIATEVFK